MGFALVASLLWLAVRKTARENDIAGSEERHELLRGVAEIEIEIERKIRNSRRRAE